MSAEGIKPDSLESDGNHEKLRRYQAIYSDGISNSYRDLEASSDEEVIEEISKFPVMPGQTMYLNNNAGDEIFKIEGPDKDKEVDESDS